MQLKIVFIIAILYGVSSIKTILLRPLSTGQPSPLLGPKNWVQLKNIVKNIIIIIIESVYRLLLSNYYYFIYRTRKVQL